VPSALRHRLIGVREFGSLDLSPPEQCEVAEKVLPMRRKAVFFFLEVKRDPKQNPAIFEAQSSAEGLFFLWHLSIRLLSRAIRSLISVEMYQIAGDIVRAARIRKNSQRRPRLSGTYVLPGRSPFGLCCRTRYEMKDSPVRSFIKKVDERHLHLLLVP